MSGTLEGGRKAAITNKLKHGENFYKEIGAKGGRNGHTGGFASNPALARIAGAKGGRNSRRGPAKNNTTHMTRNGKMPMTEIEFLERKMMICKLRDEGMRMRDIGKKIGISHTMLYAINRADSFEDYKEEMRRNAKKYREEG